MEQNKLALSVQAIEALPSPKAILDFPAVGNAFANTFAKVTGGTAEQGALVFEAEKVLYLQTVAGSSALQKADKFSHYSAFIQLAISGLSLRDGEAYIIPRGGKAVFEPGWRGKLKHINENPSVLHCHEPVLVYDVDEFDFEKGMQTRIIKHKPAKHYNQEGRVITFVYWVVEFINGPAVFIMDRDEVLAIRNQYSEPYKSYVADCKAAGKEIGESFSLRRPGQNYDAKIAPPMWIKDEGEAFKKTLVRHAYKYIPKTSKQKALEQYAMKTQGAEREKIEHIAEEVNYNELLEDLENAGNNENPNPDSNSGIPNGTNSYTPPEAAKPEPPSAPLASDTDSIPFEDIAPKNEANAAKGIGSEIQPDLPF